MKRKKTAVEPRLLDNLLSDIILPPLPDRNVDLDIGEVASHNNALRPHLAGAHCIDASNVCEFFQNSYVGDHDRFSGFWKDLKCISPPFNKFFIEWEGPLFSHARRMGTLFLACPASEAEDMVREIMGEAADATPKKCREFITRLNPKWIYVTLDFMQFDRGNHISGLRGPYHVGLVAVAEDGAYQELWMSHSSLGAISKEESMQIGASSLISLTTLAMLNCNNIERVTHEQPRHAHRSHRNRSGLPLVSYHTIHVNTAKTPAAIYATPLPNGTTQRLHEIRGHMKDYRKGKGLFGKYKGLWFWGSHLSGDGSKGVIVSDHKLT